MAVPRTLLLTRPRAQSEAFAEVLAAELPGRFRAVVSPILEIVPVAAALDLDGLQGLIFTSANGVEQFAARTPERSLTAWCVGEMTAAAARIPATNRALQVPLVQATLSAARTTTISRSRQAKPAPSPSPSPSPPTAVGVSGGDRQLRWHLSGRKSTAESRNGESSRCLGFQRSESARLALHLLI